MKTITIKGLLLTFLCALSFNFVYAQDVEGDDPSPESSITVDPTLAPEFPLTAITPTIKSSSVIFYSDGISVALEFNTDAMTPQNAQFVDKNNTSDVRNLSLSGGQAQLFGLTAGRVYNIKATGADGQSYIVGTVNTTPYVAGDPVIVSEQLYRALSAYVTVENQGVKLSTYLRQQSNISQHENIAFLQQYIMNGAVLPASIKGQYPDSYVRQAISDRGGEGECICNFVMNQVTVVIPDETGNNDFSIGPKTVTAGPTNYNNSSYWFRGAKSQGAAKYYRLISEGKTAGNKKRTETWVSGGANISDNFVRIGYHLMCIGVTELPRECECEKQVKFDFGYSTRTEARTNTGGFGCVFNQDAAAQAQDWAVAVATREKVNSVNDVQVFDSGLGIATSKCSGGVPVSVLVDAAKIGVSVFQLIKSVKTAQLNDVVNQTNQIIDKVGAVLEKITETKDCNSALIEKPLLQGTATITFKPNDPLSFMIMSGSSLEVMGLRCWVSDAKVNSSFHLAGVVTGGAPSPSTAHCCTGYFANWAYASQNGDASNRRNFINGHLALNSPGGWQTVNGIPNPSGGINIQTEVGYAIGVNLPSGQRCTKDIPIFNNPH